MFLIRLRLRPPNLLVPALIQFIAGGICRKLSAALHRLREGARSSALNIQGLSGNSVYLQAGRRRIAPASIAELSHAPGRLYQSREEATDLREHASYAGAAIGPVAQEIQQFRPKLHACLTRSGDS